MRTGVFGGTFNPPHYGHLIVAEFIRNEEGLDRVIFVPTAIPPHKREMDIVEAHHRVEMVRRAIQGNRHFQMSDIEVERGGLSFTIDTLREFHARWPNDSFHLIIGTDLLPDFQNLLASL
jgi:nicotinate-nucleotide adenylyltransferase